MAPVAQNRKMNLPARRGCGLRHLSEDSGSQIVEFAVSLPLLVVLVVAIFDFGSAFTIKQKLAYATREGARVASNQPTTDLSLNGSCGAPASVCAVRDVIDQNLVAAHMNDCGLASAGGTSGGTLIWNFTANTTCAGTLTLKIERGFTYTATLTAPFQTGTYTIEGTRVTLSYPYKWQFNKVITFLAPGATYAGNTLITSVALMQNLN
jgi:Flp pilus assembly protein TadG